MKHPILKFILAVLLVLSSSISVFAAPPVTTLGTGLGSGISIATPKFEYITLNSNYTFRIHIYNSSNGVPLHTKPSCYIDIYNPNGIEILSKTFDKSVTTNDYNLIIDKSNQTIQGLYSYITWCNSTIYNIGGFVDGSYVVVKNTQLYRLLDGKPNYTISLTIFMFAIAFFLLYFSNQFKLEGEPFGIVITKLASSLLLKMLSLATVTYMLFIIKNSTPDITVVTTLFDQYNKVFIYALMIFFVIYFIHQFVVMATNLKLKKDYEGRRLGEK